MFELTGTLQTLFFKGVEVTSHPSFDRHFEAAATPTSHRALNPHVSLSQERSHAKRSRAQSRTSNMLGALIELPSERAVGPNKLETTKQTPIQPKGGTFCSYLPADLIVYHRIEPPHVPQPIKSAEMEGMIMALQSSLPDPLLAVRLYERLYDLPPLSITTGRLRLPGFVFSLASLTAITAKHGSDSIVHVYHATTPVLGDIRIETNDDLVGMHGLMLIHPWISPLLDKDFFSGAPQFDLAMRALRLVVRLKQPFGALLLASEARVLYKRVATDSFINVQRRAETALEELMDSARIVDVQ